MRGLLLSLSGCFLLAACSTTSQFTAQVTHFQAPTTGKLANKSIVMALSPQQKSSLKDQQYATLILNQLKASGVKPLSAPPSDLEVSFNYSSDTGKTRIWQNNPAVNVGVGYGYGMPDWRFGGVWGDPFYGSRSVAETLTTHRLEILIRDMKAAGKPTVFEGSASTESGSSDFYTVGHCLIASFFNAFPLENGQVTEIQVPRDSCIQSLHSLPTAP